MDIEIQLVMRKAEQLYNIKLLHRIHMGGSGNIIFAAESGQRPYILRVKLGRVPVTPNGRNRTANTEREQQAL